MTEDKNTEDYPNAVPPPDDTGEIDLLEILRKLWIERRYILKVTGIFLLLGLFIALFSPVKYTAHCTVVPQTGKDGSGGNLGGIAAMMGVNIGAAGASGETLSPSVYPQIVKSVPFTREIMQTPIEVDKSGGNIITLYDYYTDKQYQSFSLLEGIKKYTIGLPGVLIGAVRGKETIEETSDDIAGPSLPSLSKEEERVYQTIQRSMQLNMNQKDGYLTIDYTFAEAKASAQITDRIRKTLEQYVMTFKSEKMEDNLVFVEQSFRDAQNDFLEKQERLTTFQDANRGLSTASARGTEQRLRSEYDIAFTVYSELAKQLEQAKLAVKESKPILTVIEPVVVPTQKSAPKRSMILIGFIFLGGVAGIGWILMKPFFTGLKQSVKQDKVN